MRRKFSPKVDAHALAMSLRKAGIEPGDTIVVHSSLSSIVNVDGGASTVIQALMEAVGPEGTIAMPAFCTAEDAIARSRAGNPVDLRTLPSVNGKITEAFRTHPGVLRSSHPFSPMCAWGKNARFVTEGHALDSRIAHANSPLARMRDLDGKIVGIGTNMGTVSFYHVLEDTWDGFPFDPYAPAEDVTYVDSDGNTVTRPIQRYDREKTRCRIDNDLGLRTREFFTRHMNEQGIRHEFQFGGAPAFWMPARKLYAEMQRLAERGTTIYSGAADL